MCLIVLNYQPQSSTPLTLAANRDEFYRRPSQAAQRWHDAPGVLAGRDLEQGGTWMGISESGRFAAVTNFREIPAATAVHSRGRLTADFLRGEQDAESYLNSLSQQSTLFAGFNLLIADTKGLYFFSNRENRIRRLNPGIYGLSNHLLDTPWPKLEAAKQQLTDATNHRQLQDLLTNRHQPADEELPDTGIGMEWERLLGSCFIQSEHYGTRTCSSLMVHGNGRISLQEQHFGPFGKAIESNQQQLDFTNPWSHCAAAIIQDS